MKGLQVFLRQIIGERKKVDADSLANAAMKSGEINETDDDFRWNAYRTGTVSFLNNHDYYSTGGGTYTHISAMSAEELKKKRDQLFDTAQTFLGKVKQIDGQLSMLADGTIHIPEPIKIYKETE